MDAGEALATIADVQRLARREWSVWSFLVPTGLYSVTAFAFGGSVLLHGTQWMVPLIGLTFVAAVGVLVSSTRSRRRSGISQPARKRPDRCPASGAAPVRCVSDGG